MSSSLVNISIRRILGLNVLSNWIGSENTTTAISGTPMTSPHTASLLAHLLSLYPSKSFDPNASVSVSPLRRSIHPAPRVGHSRRSQGVAI